MSDFPSSKFERGKIFAKSGLKAGSNYAKFYINKTINGDSTADKSGVHTETAKQLFNEFTKLRGTALKIAQSLSIDQGFLPDEFTEVMTQAQYNVPPINRALVRSIIKQELGKYPEQLFKSFDSNAIAAASIGQVHKAVLHNGTRVAIKIQYPGVRDTISTDLALAKTLFKRFLKKGSDIDGYFEEVKNTLIRETDYIIEGKSIEHFHIRFAGDSVITPRWIREFSSERVLTMTFIEGVHLDEFLKSNPDQNRINHFGQILWDFFHDQVNDHEEIHADTHPGNFLFTPDGKLGVIDFGCVKTFPEEFFTDYLRLLPTHLEEDDKAIADLYLKLDVLKNRPENDKTEKAYFDFCRDYGNSFALPYKNDRFDFGDPEYSQLIRTKTKNAPVTNEPRGNKNFIYSTRVHLGLYHFLMRLGAEVSTGKSIDIVNRVILQSDTKKAV